MTTDYVQLLRAAADMIEDRATPADHAPECSFSRWQSEPLTAAYPGIAPASCTCDALRIVRRLRDWAAELATPEQE